MIPKELYEFGLYFNEFKCFTFQSGFHFPELENNFSIRLVFHRISCSEFRSHFCCSGTTDGKQLQGLTEDLSFSSDYYES